MSSERITPLFFDLEAHTLTKKNGCGAFMGVCLPSEWKISPSQYTLDYNIKLAKEFHKTLEEIGSLILHSICEPLPQPKYKLPCASVLR